MALDGITIHSLVLELKELLIDGRIDKIHQPEKDEIILHIRSKGKNYKLLFSASANDARAHLTSLNKSNPLQAPMFCMLLRKHLSAGKVVAIIQPELERILEFHIESMNELGDLSIKRLIVEMMGRHSNIILVNENDIILDSIKHVNFNVSRVREVMPGKEYKNPPSQNKFNPLHISQDDFIKALKELPTGTKIDKGILNCLMGISIVTAREICSRSAVDMNLYIGELHERQYSALFQSLIHLLQEIENQHIHPSLIYGQNNTIVEFAPVSLQLFNGYPTQAYSSLSEVIEAFFSKRDLAYRLKQKSAETFKLLQNNLDRCYKKKEIQFQTLKEVEDREQFRIFGDLITANIYQINLGQTKLITPNFYAENYEEIEVPLDPHLTPSENAQKYFKKYTKAKNTLTMVEEQMVLNEEEIAYLESLLNFLEHVQSESDIEEIREELSESGYIRKRNLKKKQKQKQTFHPLHYRSKDGFDIFIGKNNRQNDELTLKFARSYDLWLHTKDIPGSHVIIQTKHQEVPDSTIHEAALLAAYYSKAKMSSRVPVDFTERKNVKKPSGAKPGMVIYENNKTIYITPEESLIKQIEQES